MCGEVQLKGTKGNKTMSAFSRSVVEKMHTDCRTVARIEHALERKEKD